MAIWSIIKTSELEGTKRLDPEYYHPAFLQIDRYINTSHLQWKTLEEISTVPITKGETPLWRGDSYQDSGVLFLRSENLIPCSAETSNCVFISDKVDKRMRRSRIESGDVLIAIVGTTTGAVGLMPEDISKANTNQAIARIRNPSLNRFLSIYLLTDLAQKQIERLSGGGAARDNLDLHQVKKLKCPIPNINVINKINEEVRKIQSAYADAKSLYIQAEQTLLNEIGWDKLNLSQPKWWIAYFSKARDAHRFDAEHFQPKYGKLLEHLKKTGKAKQVADILAEPIKKGVTPDYEPSGPIVVVNSQHLGRYNLNYEATDRTTETFWKANNRSQIRQNDVMMYATGAYIGRTNTYLEQARAIAGVDVLLVRPTRETNPLYLSVFLNALPGLMQSKKFSSGSGQAHIYPDNVCSYWIYAPPETFQQKIADLVQQSYKARQKAKALLEEAKAKVENLIEKRERHNNLS